MTKPVKDQIKDRIYSFISEGVEKFPKTFPHILSTKLQKIPLNDASQSSTNENTNTGKVIFEKISNCQLCPLSNTRKKVVVSPVITKKKFFILSEFPEGENEKSQSSLLFSEKSSSALILKLLEKLGILQNCHFSFALKCVPEKGIPQGALSICAQNNLKEELKAVDPNVILCFGLRSLLAIIQFESKLLSHDFSENTSCFNLNFENSEKKVFFLSSSLDLQSFPQWRAQVWNFLGHLKIEA